jgi:hypothetical protein
VTAIHRLPVQMKRVALALIVKAIKMLNGLFLLCVK